MKHLIPIHLFVSFLFSGCSAPSSPLTSPAPKTSNHHDTTEDSSTRTDEDEALQMCTFLQESTAAAAELMQPDLCRMASILMTILRTSLPSPAMDNENGETSHEAICEAELTRCLAEGIDEEKIRDIPNRCADASKWRHQGCTVSFDELKACLEAWHPARIENLNAFVSNLPDCADLDRWLAVDNAIPERDVDIPVPDPCHSIVTTCPEMAAHIGLKK